MAIVGSWWGGAGPLGRRIRGGEEPRGEGRTGQVGRLMLVMLINRHVHQSKSSNPCPETPGGRGGWGGDQRGRGDYGGRGRGEMARGRGDFGGGRGRGMREDYGGGDSRSSRGGREEAGRGDGRSSRGGRGDFGRGDGRSSRGFPSTPSPTTSASAGDLHAFGDMGAAAKSYAAAAPKFPSGMGGEGAGGVPR